MYITSRNKRYYEYLDIFQFDSVIFVFSSFKFRRYPMQKLKLENTYSYRCQKIVNT